jgi:hypothetical protein
MKVIYKYPLEITDTQTVELPYEHRILSVQAQNGILCLWAAVDLEETFKADRTIRIIGTGNQSDELDFYFSGDMEFISTVQLSGLVWHVFTDC